MFCLRFCFSQQTKQICSFIFWEDLRCANPAFGFIWPLGGPLSCFSKFIFFHCGSDRFHPSKFSNRAFCSTSDCCGLELLNSFLLNCELLAHHSLTTLRLNNRVNPDEKTSIFLCFSLRNKWHCSLVFFFIYFGPVVIKQRNFSSLTENRTFPSVLQRLPLLPFTNLGHTLVEALQLSKVFLIKQSSLIYSIGFIIPLIFIINKKLGVICFIL